MYGYDENYTRGEQGGYYIRADGSVTNHPPECCCNRCDPGFADYAAIDAAYAKVDLAERLCQSAQGRYVQARASFHLGQDGDDHLRLGSALTRREKELRFASRVYRRVLAEFDAVAGIR